MSTDFSIDGWVVAVNGRPLTDWGETDPPYTDAPIDPRAVLRRGLGGRACKINRKNPGRQVTLNMNPGSPDSAYLSGLLNAGTDIQISATQVGTLESKVGTEGVIVNDGTDGRGGTAISDDQYIIEFNIWAATKGGE